jgi:Arc/MetJ-type ribon-helix-helix transcriptional regulator
MTIQVPLRLTEQDVAALDGLVAAGAFRNRSDALRAGLTALLREQRQGEIDGAYARGYGQHPQEEWIAEAGLAGLDAFHRSEGGEPL